MHYFRRSGPFSAIFQPFAPVLSRFQPNISQKSTITFSFLANSNTSQGKVLKKGNTAVRVPMLNRGPLVQLNVDALQNLSNRRFPGYFWHFVRLFLTFARLFLTFFTAIFDVSPTVLDVFFSAISDIFSFILDVFFGCFWRFFFG